VVGVLDLLKMNYMESLDDNLSLAVRRERSNAWATDAATAAARIRTGEYAIAIQNHAEDARRFADIERLS